MVFHLRSRFGDSRMDKSTHYECMIEWISFDRLDDINIIGQGGFSTVYSATWLDGVRKIEKVKKNDGNDVDIEEYVRSRGPPCTVALKTLLGPKENPHFFLKEFECFIKCGYWGSGLKLYGLTQNPNTNEYMIAFQYAENGYIHADLHSGNVLQDGGINKNLRSYVSDLGLSKKYNTNESKGGIYGVLPYIAPEVLSGQRFTKAADIYGFGVIMSEMSTGQRPFDGRPFNLNLSIDICRGLRPGFAPGTPDPYIELAKQCMDSDPKKRPVAYDIWIKLKEWDNCMESSDEADEIKKKFLDADEISKELPIIPPKHPDSMYTSKIIDTQIISSALIKGIIPSETLNSVQIPFV
ncbi:kinase-like domain-containing protein [Gigaspora rosea]|uniref:Kinase-like domain-containing protein n=1 Tax=Gigaspora rosea TaxID=44941 RepID=A0A397W8P1_9GLOM|nr:kinase-like domain-containing protein [Gigaspora rosea]